MKFKIGSMLFVCCAFFANCQIELRLYRPYPKEGFYSDLQKFPQILLKFPKGDPSLQARTKHDFFGEELFPNAYGNWETLISKEMTLRKHRYPALVREGGEIVLEEFVLESKDSCTKNQTYVSLKASVRLGKNKPSAFAYQDEKETYLSNCIFTGSLVTLVPLLWYIPYMGYQGNREDQLNQLGRNSLEAFFQFLEYESGGDPKKKDSEIPIVPESIDPRLQEILNEL